MCGSSTRLSQGGSIAVLRPTCLTRTHSEEEMLLLFRNQFASSGTSVELQGLDPQLQQNSHWIVIHQDGDLSTPQTTTLSIPNPLYSFSLNADAESTLQLPQKLDLGVGDRGIIGRRVSMMVGSSEGPVAVAEGIIGWN